MYMCIYSTVPIALHISLHTSMRISTTTNDLQQQHAATTYCTPFSAGGVGDSFRPGPTTAKRTHGPHESAQTPRTHPTDPAPDPQRTPRTPQTRNGPGPELDHSHVCTLVNTLLYIY